MSEQTTETGLTAAERAELENVDFSHGLYGWPEVFEITERIIAERLDAAYDHAWKDGFRGRYANPYIAPRTVDGLEMIWCGRCGDWARPDVPHP